MVFRLVPTAVTLNGSDIVRRNTR